MKVSLAIEINCGETTCASAPGEWCKYAGSRRFGTDAVCRLFPTPDDSCTPLEIRDGWTQRCDACLNATARHDALDQFKAELAAKQKPLGALFESVLLDNLESLYVKS